MRKKYYEVQHISKMKIQNGVKFYRVKWVGFPSKFNTWEPQQHLSEALIQKFEQSQIDRSFRKSCKMKNLIGQNKNKTRKYTIKIIEMKQNEEDGTKEFVIRNGIRKQVVDRQYLYNNHPQMLARFYLKTYLNKTEMSQQ